MLLPINPAHPEPRKIRQAVDVLERGGVIAYPTGTVFGFGADLFNKKAVERVYQIKGARTDKPFSFLCADLSEIARYARVPDAAYRIMRRLVPGPYTFVLEATKEVPKLCLSRRKTVGIRVPEHPVARALLEVFGRPIISTSAKRDDDDEWSLNDPAELAVKFKQLDLILDAGLAGFVPSTVIAFHESGEVEVLRRGAGPVDGIL
ncbi:MAG: L-threonylcarbamoyladenylate synthase [Proteobacteria bacterium]|jgi:tRNA threonylcarbamoyl adenosine modification protein (Sua5/YciO/YrdC/YwlC family)|nr:L-threonylcarbamoyladenylate synthase [Pseudomonadota bacterium]